jgi:MFS family permease
MARGARCSSMGPMTGNLSSVRRVPGAVSLLLYVGCARLGVPALSLAMLLAARDTVGGYAGAGVIGAAYALAVAPSQLVWGRAADRRGPGPILRVTAVGHGAALALFAVLVSAGATLPPLVASAAIAGASFPPMATVSRAAWQRVADARSQRALYALDGLTTELTLIAGPLLAGVLVAAAGGAAAVAAVGALVALGVLAGSRSPLLGAPADHRGGAPRRSRAPRALLGLLAATVAMAAAIGAVTIASVSFAERAALPSGLPLTLIAGGGVAGTLVWGASTIRLPRRTQLVGGLVLYGNATAAATVVPPFVALALLVVAGGLMAPCDALQAQLCGELAPRARLTESFAWLNSANWIGFSAGTSLSGPVVDEAGAAGGLLLCAAAAIVAAIVVGAATPARTSRSGTR